MKNTKLVSKVSLLFFTGLLVLTSACGDTAQKDTLLFISEQEAAEYLQAEENLTFDPHRPAIGQKEDYEIICQCGGVTRGQILEAIARGATTVDGIKRRVGSGMGPCQGGRCVHEIVKLLKKAGVNPDPLQE